MANKQNFTPEEWTKLLQSPMLAGMAVSAAEPSGLFGTLKEAFASSAALAAAKRDSGANALIKAIVTDFETAEGRAKVQEAMRARFFGAKPADMTGRAIASLKEAAEIVTAKAPEDAAAYKAWLAAISQRVAEAASEGGFLGFGGVKVSEAEKATLAEIAKALGTSA